MRLEEKCDEKCDEKLGSDALELICALCPVPCALCSVPPCALCSVQYVYVRMCRLDVLCCHTYTNKARTFFLLSPFFLISSPLPQIHTPVQ